MPSTGTGTAHVTAADLFLVTRTSLQYPSPQSEATVWVTARLAPVRAGRATLNVLVAAAGMAPESYTCSRSAHLSGCD